MKLAVDLSCVALGDVAELTRIPLAILGKFVWAGRKFHITKDTIGQFLANFRKRTADVVIDYEHASAEPERAGGKPVPAAGWLKLIEDAPDDKGILWGLAEFTQRAREMIAAKEIKYISPEINFAARDKVSGGPQGATLAAIALTNRPFLDAMPEVRLSDTGWQILGRKDDVMKARKVTLAESGKQAIVFCGGEGEEEIQVEMDLGMAGLVKAPDVVHLSDITRTDDGRLDFSAIQTNGETLIAGEVFQAMQAQAALEDAVKAGKILPAQRKHYEAMALSDLAGFRELVGTMKPQVDLSEHGTGAGGGELKGDLAKVDSRLTELTKMLLSEKKDLTYGQAFKLILRENPELATERARLMKSPAVSEE